MESHNLHSCVFPAPWRLEAQTPTHPVSNRAWHAVIPENNTDWQPSRQPAECVKAVNTKESLLCPTSTLPATGHRNPFVKKKGNANCSKWGYFISLPDFHPNPGKKKTVKKQAIEINKNETIISESQGH